MVATYTDNLRLTKQGDDDNPTTWGQVVNTQVTELLEEAIAGVAEVDVSGSSDVNISTSAVNGGTDTARHAVLELTGVISTDINLIVPSVEKTYLIKADYSGGVVTIIPSGGGSGIELTTGLNYIVYTNGTNIEKIADNAAPDLSAYLEISNNLSDVASVSTSRDNLGISDSDILNLIYPVGSIYTNASDDTNPGTLLGFGTWEAFASGRVMVGKDSGDTDFDTAEETGGSKEHQLTVDEMPSHEHEYFDKYPKESGSPEQFGLTGGGPIAIDTRDTETVGGDQAHNNLQPYIVVHMWKRTA